MGQKQRKGSTVGQGRLRLVHCEIAVVPWPQVPHLHGSPAFEKARSEMRARLTTPEGRAAYGARMQPLSRSSQVSKATWIQASELTPRTDGAREVLLKLLAHNLGRLVATRTHRRLFVPGSRWRNLSDLKRAGWQGGRWVRSPAGGAERGRWAGTDPDSEPDCPQPSLS